jgi:predicted ester cyclase
MPRTTSYPPTTSTTIRPPRGAARSAFPDIHFETGETTGEGDTVAHRWAFTGTHEGETLGVEPAGMRVEVAGVGMNRVEGGRISASWTVSDALGLVGQLGLAPSPGRMLLTPDRQRP